MSADRFESILQRLEKSGIAMPSDLEGCTASEIADLESKYRLRLPSVYRRFLRIMGHQCGWLFASEQVAVDYWTVLDLTDELRSSLASKDPELAKRIPFDALFILAGDEVDLFVRCGRGEDPPVHLLNSAERKIEVVHSSVSEWLEKGCETAEEAIAEGYFEALSIPRKTDIPRVRPKPKPPAEPVPYSLLCPGCGKRLVFPSPSMEYARIINLSFLYNDAGTSTLVWTALDPSYQAMFGNQKPWDLSPEQQTAFEARLKPAPAGGRWRFANYPRCPHCKAAVSRPMTKGELCLVYEGSLVLREPNTGRGLSQALIQGAATPVTTPKPTGAPGPREITCSGCAGRIPFHAPTTDDVRLQNLAFLYNDAGTSTLVWATTDPVYRDMFGNQKPWDLSPEQQAELEGRLKPAPAGGQWRFANPARCPRCGTAISPPMTQSDLCLAYEDSLLVQHWISGSSLRRALK